MPCIPISINPTPRSPWSRLRIQPPPRRNPVRNRLVKSWYVRFARKNSPEMLRSSQRTTTIFWPLRSCLATMLARRPSRWPLPSITTCLAFRLAVCTCQYHCHPAMPPSPAEFGASRSVQECSREFGAMAVSQILLVQSTGAWANVPQTRTKTFCDRVAAGCFLTLAMLMVGLRLFCVCRKLALVQ